MEHRRGSGRDFDDPQTRVGRAAGHARVVCGRPQRAVLPHRGLQPVVSGVEGAAVQLLRGRRHRGRLHRGVRLVPGNRAVGRSPGEGDEAERRAPGGATPGSQARRLPTRVVVRQELRRARSHGDDGNDVEPRHIGQERVVPDGTTGQQIRLLHDPCLLSGEGRPVGEVIPCNDELVVADADLRLVGQRPGRGREPVHRPACSGVR